ncbi:MAG: hypothetical protein MAG458_01502 [Nitrosopumilus sp.]|nr:hypothetical protein [Nitrosopumilus sp.]
MEYAEEPIGVDTITPSPLSCHTSSPFTRSVCSMRIALLEEKTATSFRTGYTFRPSIFTPRRGTFSTVYFCFFKTSTKEENSFRSI